CSSGFRPGFPQPLAARRTLMRWKLEHPWAARPAPDLASGLQGSDRRCVIFRPQPTGQERVERNSRRQRNIGSRRALIAWAGWPDEYWEWAQPSSGSGGGALKPAV